MKKLNRLLSVLLIIFTITSIITPSFKAYASEEKPSQEEIDRHTPITGKNVEKKVENVTPNFDNNSLEKRLWHSDENYYGALDLKNVNWSINNIKDVKKTVNKKVSLNTYKIDNNNFPNELNYNDGEFVGKLAKKGEPKWEETGVQDNRRIWRTAVVTQWDGTPDAYEISYYDEPTNTTVRGTIPRNGSQSETGSKQYKTLNGYVNNHNGTPQLGYYNSNYDTYYGTSYYYANAPRWANDVYDGYAWIIGSRTESPDQGWAAYSSNWFHTKDDPSSSSMNGCHTRDNGYYTKYTWDGSGEVGSKSRYRKLVAQIYYTTSKREYTCKYAGYIELPNISDGYIGYVDYEGEVSKKEIGDYKANIDYKGDVYQRIKANWISRYDLNNIPKGEYMYFNDMQTYDNKITKVVCEMIDKNGNVAWSKTQDKFKSGTAKPLPVVPTTPTPPQLEKPEPPKPIKTRYIRETCEGNTSNKNSNFVELQAFENGVNVALNKKVKVIKGQESTAYDNVNLSVWVDGDINADNHLRFGGPIATLEVDLGKEYDITDIKVWNYYVGGRTYSYSIDISSDGVNWYRVWNQNEKFVETEAGNNIKVNATTENIPQKVSEPIKPRYIRNTLSGNTENADSHWVELQAFENGANISQGKEVSLINGTFTIGNTINALVDGDLNTQNYIGFKNSVATLQVDLGKQTSIDTIKLWHYYGDVRSYMNNKVHVSEDGVNWYLLFDSETMGRYQEKSMGRTIYMTADKDDKVDYVSKNRVFKTRYIRNYVNGSNVSGGSHYIELEAIKGSENVARNKKVRLINGTLNKDKPSDYGYINIFTDGNKNATPYIDLIPYGGTTALEVDLGSKYELDEVKIWHYYPGGRTYKDNKIYVSENGEEWYKIFDSNINGTYQESSEGKTVKVVITENQEPEFRDARPNRKARYIRSHLNGSSANEGNHWVELEVYSGGSNVARGKPVAVEIGEVVAAGGNGGSIGSLEVFTDGNKSTTPYCETKGNYPGAIRVDLGKSYDLDEIKIWHYFADGRTYYSNRIEISENGTDWQIVFDSEIDGRYAETADGKSIALSDNAGNYIKEPKITYRAYVEGVGWQAWVSNGQTAGTTGQDKHIEALEIRLEDINGSVVYRSHLSNTGWMEWQSMGATSGRPGDGQQMEAFELKSENISGKTIEYRVHVGFVGWMDWIQQGGMAGTTGEGKDIQAIEIRLK